MKVIVPLAGFGSRLRPHTFSKPKPLINVAGKAVLGHVLDMFEGVDVEEFVFITGYLGEQVEDYVAEKYPNLKTQFKQQKELNGQSPAVLLAEEYVDGPILIAFVDTIIHAPLAELNDERADAVVYVKRVEDPRRFGVVEVGANSYVSRLIEKPETVENDLAVVGFYYMKDGPGFMKAIHRQIDENIMTKGEYYLADAIQLMLDDGMKLRAEQVEVWEDCGKPETVLQTNRFLLDNGSDNSADFPEGNYIINPPVYIHPSATIENSVVGPHVSVGADCVIKNAIIRDSIMDVGAMVEDGILGQSLIGQDAKVGGRFRQFNVGDKSVIGYE